MLTAHPDGHPPGEAMSQVEIRGQKEKGIYPSYLLCIKIRRCKYILHQWVFIDIYIYTQIVSISMYIIYSMYLQTAGLHDFFITSLETYYPPFPMLQKIQLKSTRDFAGVSSTTKNCRVPTPIGRFSERWVYLQ